MWPLPDRDLTVIWPWPDRDLTVTWSWAAPHLTVTWPWRYFECTSCVNQAVKLVSQHGILCHVAGWSVPYFNTNIYFLSWFPCSPQGILSDRAGMVGLQSQHAAKCSLDVCGSKSRTLNEMEHNVRDIFCHSSSWLLKENSWSYILTAADVCARDAAYIYTWH